VADVSLVASGKDRKKHINSNVGIELGYTYGKLGDEAVLKVMNTHYGSATELPFDLRTRRHPLQYCLEPEANAETISSERKKLAGQIAGVLKLYLEQTYRLKEVDHAEMQSVGQRGAFWLPGDIIVPADDRYGRTDTYLNVPSLVYFRCIPKKKLTMLTSLQAYEAVDNLRPLLSSGGYSRSRNKWGAVVHCMTSTGDLMGFTQLFKNREIWGVDAYYSNIATTPKGEDEESKRYIPTSPVQREYPSAINSLRKVAEQLGYGEEYYIEMGISNASGVHLAIDTRYRENFLGPLFDDNVFTRQTVAADLPDGQVMNFFWEKLFSEAGRDVPSELIWRPQN